MHRTRSLFIAVLLASAQLYAEPLGGPHFDNWTGVTPGPEGAVLNAPADAATFRYPDGPRGFYKHGFRIENDSAFDWNAFYGLRFEIKLPGAGPVELKAVLEPAAPGGGAGKPVESVVNIAGEGWHTVTLPWTAFQFEQTRTSFLTFIKQLTLAVRSADGNAPEALTLRNVSLINAPAVALECPIRGKAAPQGRPVEYPVTVSNCTGQPEAVALSFIRHGWEVMDATVEPAALLLAPGESKPCIVRVTVPDRIPPGGHEQQTLQAIANGDASAAEKLLFVTVSELPHPYILHTPARWAEVREKVAKYPWARDAQDAFVKTAEAWNVPEVAKPPANDPNDTMGPYLFRTNNENDLLAAAFSWELTGNKSHAEKVALFLRRLSDPADGYPVTLRGCNQSLVQEGHFFQHIAMAYDMILDSGVLSDADRAQIEATFRIFMQTIARENRRGAINNWNLSEVIAAPFTAPWRCRTWFPRSASSPARRASRTSLPRATMDDGWWYECSISYNMWCASEFTQAALA